MSVASKPSVLRLTSLLALLALAALMFWALAADPASAEGGAEISSGPTITSSPQNGAAYAAGETISVAVSFSAAVTVSGSPRLRLEVGEKRRWARYLGADASGTTLSFAYVVKAADQDADGLSFKKNSLDLDGGKIEDAEGNRARLRHGSVSDQAGQQVDGSPVAPEDPAGTAVVIAAEVVASAVSALSEALATQTPTNSEPQFAADIATRSVAEHSPAGAPVGEPVIASDADDDALSYTLSGSASFQVDAASGQISVAEGAELDYETQAAYRLTVGVSDGKNAAGAADAVVDDTIQVSVSLTDVAEQQQVIVGPEDPPPSVSAGPILNAPRSGGSYNAGEEIVVTLIFSEAVTVSGTPRIGVVIGETRRWAKYSGSAGGDTALSFSYTVQAEDRDDDGIRIRQNALRLNGGTIVDGEGNAANLEHAAWAPSSNHQVNGSALAGEPQTAQTAVKLVGNSGQTVSGTTTTFAFSADQAQAFTTGSNAQGYKLTRLDLWIRHQGAALSYSVKVYSSNSSGRPNNSLGTLTNPSSLPTGTFQSAQFTASGDGIDLAANTTYFVVVDSGEGRGTTRLRTTIRGTEDAGAAAGWSIANGAFYRNWDSSGGWTTHNAARLVDIYGYAKSTTTDTTAPTVTAASTGYYSDAALTTTLTGSRKSGASIYTKVTFSEDMKHVKSDGASARPELFHRIGTTDSQYDILDNGDTLASGDCKPNHATDTNVYVCLYTVGSSDNGAFAVKAGTNSVDKADNALASAYTHAASVTLDTTDPGIVFPTTGTPTVGSEWTITLSDAGSMVKKYGAIVVDGSTGAAADCDSASEITGDLTTETTALASKNFAYTVPDGSAGKKVCVYVEDAAGNSVSALDDDAIAMAMEVNPGAVAIRGKPQVGVVLTAVLSDADGDVKNLTWKWARSDTQAGTYTDIPGKTAATYTPSDADEGKWLRATASYTDAQGPNKTARAVAATVVAAVDLALPVGHLVPANWSLIPKDGSNNPLFTEGESFRLLFATSTLHFADSSDIAHYNGIVQRRANSNANLGPFGGEFRALISTETVHARDNTGTAPADSRFADGEGVPIYWVGGLKVADDYKDFYDNTWDNLAGRTEAGGTAVPAAARYKRYSVWTGSKPDGTRHANYAGSGGSVRYGSFKGNSGSPLSVGNAVRPETPFSRLYGLSPVITIEADTTAPTIRAAAITSDPGDDGAYKIGDRVVATVFFDEPVTVVGTPTIALTVGSEVRTVDYAGGSGSSRLRFSYTVRANDADADGVSIAGGSTFITLPTTPAASIKDAAATPNAASLSFTAGLGDQSGHKVDGVKPTIPSAPAITSNPGAENAYTGGDVIQATLTFNEAIRVTGHPTLTIKVGAANKTAACAAHATNNTKLVCAYTVATSDEDTDGIEIEASKLTLGSGVTIKDAVGNNAVLTHAALTTRSGHKVTRSGDTTRPTIVSVAFTSTPAGDAYTEGNNIEATVTFSEDVIVVGAPTLALRIGSNTRYAVYRSGSNSTMLIFSYRVGIGDHDADGISIKSGTIIRLPQGASIKDAATNTAVLTLASAVSSTQKVDNAPTGGNVPSGWALIPKDSQNSPLFTDGQSFRLLFVTSTYHSARFTDIATYNSAVQHRANSNTNLKSFHGEFRALISTSEVQARDNTGTAPAGAAFVDGEGVAIYWVGGPKVADDYKDFYDGNWDSRDRRIETGGSISLSFGQENLVWTGSNQDGTRHDSEHAGSGGKVRIGFLGTTNNFPHNPLNASRSDDTDSHPLYGLSPVFTVGDDTTEPTIRGVSISSDAGMDDTYIQGDKIEVTVTFSEIVTVTIPSGAAKPTLGLLVGANTRTATYKGGSGSSRLRFTYTVAANEEDADGVSIPGHATNPLITLASNVTIKDVAATPNAANLAFTAGLAAQNSHKVDAKPPTKPALSAAAASASVALSWTNPSDASIVKYQYRQKKGSADYGDWTDIPGSNASTTRYSVTGLENGVTYTFQVRALDAANTGPASDAVMAEPVAADTTPPTVSSVEFTSNAGSDETYKAGDAIRATVTFSEPIAVSGTPALAITVGTVEKSADCILNPSDSTKLVCTYTVAATDEDTDGISIGENKLSLPGSPAATIKDKATPTANDANRNHSAVAADSSHKVDAKPPIKPALSAAPASGAVTLSWTNPNDASIVKYQYRQKAAGAYGAWTDIPDSAPGEMNATSFTVLSLMNGTEYTFQIRALDAANTGPESDAVMEIPVAPTVTPSVGVWSATLTVDQDTGAPEYRGCDNGEATIADCSTASVLTDDDFEYPSGTTYTIEGLYWDSDSDLLYLAFSSSTARVALRALTLKVGSGSTAKTFAIADTGSSIYWSADLGWSDGDTVSLSLSAGPVAPAKPTGFKAAGGERQVTLSWEDPDDASITKWQYLQRESGETSDWMDIPGSGATTTSYTVPGLKRGTYYSFHIRAVNAVGNGPISEGVSGLTSTLGVTVSTGRVTVTEASGAGRTATYTVALRTQPTGEVTVTPTIGDTSVATVDPATLTFTTTNWNVAQTVTVTGVDDDVDADCGRHGCTTITHTVSGADYDGITATSIKVDRIDDDTAGVTVTPTSVTVTEASGAGHTATYTVKLDSQPTGDVTMTATSGHTGVATVDPTSLTFTPDNWATAQTVTVTGVDDDVDSDRSTPILHDVSGGDYGSVTAASVVVTLTDDDAKGVTVSQTDALPVDEGGMATYTVVLDSQPQADVTVTPSSDDTTSVTVSGALTFSTSTWNTTQTVTVSGVQDMDTDDESVTISHAVAGPGSGYVGVTAVSVSVSVTDDDPANTAPVFTDGTTTTRMVAENTAADTNFGAAVVATDPGDTLTYSLGGTDAASFDIATTSGQLKTKATLDYETKSSYSVTVTATDSQGATDTITVTITVTDENEPPGKPIPPTFGAVTASSLVVNWTAPDNTGPAITDYDVQYQKSGVSGWSDHAHSGTATTATITGLDPDSSYQVQVRATNDEGMGEWSNSGTGSTSAAPNAAPTFSSSAAVSVAENNTLVVTVMASDADSGDSITGYAITGGADSASFSIDSTSGALTFNTAPNFEMPTDSGMNNVYDVTVEATGGTGGREMKATHDIAITVTNVDEPGTVSFDSDAPTVGMALTASVTDPDGSVSGVSWAWSRSDTQGGTFTAISGATNAAYTPVESDVDKWLKAAASYTDGHGSNKSESANTAAAVAAQPKVTLNVSPSSISENGGVTTVTAMLDKAATEETTITVSASPVSPAVAADYDLSTNTTLTFASGATASTGAVTITAANNDVDAANKTVDVSGTIASGSATAPDDVTLTITDDDAPPTLSIADATLEEAAAVMSFTVTLSAASGQQVMVSYATSDGTATAGADYTAVTAGTLTFAPGDTSKTVTVPILEDALNEADETFKVTLSGPSNATIADASGTGTITDDDDPPTLSIANATLGEAAADMSFTVTLSAASGREVTVSYATSDGTATAGADYTAVTAGTLAFAPGDTSMTATVPILEDALDEADETFKVTLSGPSNATLADAEATGTITDDDEVAQPSFTDRENASRSVPENTPKGIRVGAAIAATPANEGDTLTYALAGADAAAFKIDEHTGQLRFEKALDYENPADEASTTPTNAATNNEYVVSVTVTDGKDSDGNAETVPVVDDTITVTISVTDVDEKGRLTLSPTRPKVGSAVTATVADPDGATSPTWKWERSAGRTSWTTISGATSASYTPTAADAGRFLRATATYTDSHGAGKQVEATATEVVRTAHELSKLEIATTSARKMYPAFNAGTLHYAVGCQAGTSDNAAVAELTITLAAAAPMTTRLAVNGTRHVSTEHTFTLNPASDTDQIAITLSGATGASTTYVVHCLDNTIREISTAKTPGATGIIEELMIFSNAPNVMVIDNNGVPRWYADAGSAGPFFRYFELDNGSRRYFYSRPTSYADTGTLGSDWYELDDDFNHVDWISTVSPLTLTDTHDIILTEDGGNLRYVVSSYEPARRDLSGLRLVTESKYRAKRKPGNSLPVFPRDAAYTDSDVVGFGTVDITDSVIQVRTPNTAPKDKSKKGTQEWVWNSWDHLPMEDCVQNTTRNAFPLGYSHFNSIELLPDGDFIASFRGCSTVLRIDRDTGDVVWRLGRTNLTDAEWETVNGNGNGDGPAPLEILDDPYGEFCGQHSAYLLENGNLIVFDNGVRCVMNPADGTVTRVTNNYFSRAVEYALDPESGEAVFQRHHALHNLFPTDPTDPNDVKGYLGYWSGHVEELDNGDWLVGWGGMSPGARMSRSLPPAALTPDHSATQVDPDTKQEKFSITIGYVDDPNDNSDGSIDDIRPIPLSPVALAAKVLPLTATTITNSSSSTHSGASDSPKVVVVFNQPIVDIDKATQSVMVTGATVDSVAPHIEADAQANAYVFTLSPIDNSDITFNLVASKSCASAAKGICTASGGQLTRALTSARTIAYSATPKVTLELTPSSIGESGSNHSTTVTATLNSAVSAATTVRVSAAAGTAGTSEFTLSPNKTLTIAANAKTSTGVVSITAVDDQVDEGNETVIVSGAVTSGTPAAGTPAAPEDVTLTITDDDTKGVTVSQSTALPVNEGGTATYTVVLNSQPLADVMVTPSSDDTTRVTVSDALTFTSSNWNTAQMVTVTGKQDMDNDDETVTISHAVTGMNNGYAGVTAASVSVMVNDDEPANFAPVFSPDAVTRSVPENSSAGTNVGAPIPAATDADSPSLTYSMGGTDAASFSFDTATRQITVKSGTSLNFESTKNSYSVTVTATDSQSATDAITVTINVTNVNEAPTLSGDATVDYAENGTGPVETYSVSDPDTGSTHAWSLAGADAAAFSISSGGALAFQSPPNHEDKSSYAVTVKVADHGSPALSGTLAVTVNVTDVAEPPGKPGAPTIDSASTNSLTVSWQAPDNTGRPAITDYDVRYQKRPSGGWNPHDHTGTTTNTTISGLVTGSRYQVQVRATNPEGPGDWSNSARGSTTTKPTVTLVLEESSIDESGTGNATTIKATLPSEAAAQTTVTLSADTTKVTLGATTLTIASGATDSPTTTVTAVDNNVDADSDASVTIGGTVSPTSVAAPDDVTLTITDDDMKGVTISQTSLAVTEASGTGNTATYTVVLDSQPLANVMVTPSSGDTTSVTVSGALTFTSSNWNMTQTVTVTGVQDMDNVDETVPISHAVTGANNGYAGVSAASVSVMVNDDEPDNYAPVFSADAVIRSVPENSTAGASVGAAVAATDRDSNTLTYTLMGPGHGNFTVDGSGQVKVSSSASLDHETTPPYTLTLSVHDGEDDDGNPSTTVDDTITLTITVTDVAEPPGKPAPPTFGSATTNSLVVNWIAPTNTGPAITDYDVQYRKGNSGNWSDAPHNDATITTTITGLDADASYQVQVRARNAEGTGVWSEPGTGSTTALSAPDAPAGLGASAADRFQINLTWTAPTAATGQAAVTGYKLQRSANGSDWTALMTIPNAGTTTYSHTGLDPSTTQRYRVRATSSAGDSAWSSTALATTKANAAPAFSSDTDTRSVAENSAPNINIGAAVTAIDGDGDTLTYRLDGTDASSFKIVATSGQLRTRADLDYETKSSYSVTVTARDDYGGSGSITVTITVTDVVDATVTSGTAAGAVTFTISGIAPATPATGGVTLTVPTGSSLAPAGTSVTLPKTVSDRLASATPKVAVTVKTVTPTGNQAAPPAGFSLAGVTVDISGITLNSGETATVCLPRPSGSAATSIHRYDGQSWVKLSPADPAIRTKNGLTLVCAMTDKFSLFALTRLVDENTPTLLISMGVGRIGPTLSSLDPVFRHADPQWFGQGMELASDSNAAHFIATPRFQLTRSPVDVRVRVKHIAVGDHDAYTLRNLPKRGKWVTNYAGEDLSRMIGEATRSWGTLKVRDRQQVKDSSVVGVMGMADDPDDWDGAVVYMYPDSAAGSIQCRTPAEPARYRNGKMIRRAVDAGSWHNLASDGTCPVANIKFKLASRPWTTVTIIDPQTGDAPAATNPSKVARLSFTQDSIEESKEGSASIKIELDSEAVASKNTTFKVYIPKPVGSDNYQLLEDSECSYEGPFCVLKLTISKGQKSVTSTLAIKAKRTNKYDDPYELTVIAEKTGGDGSVGFYRKWTKGSLTSTYAGSDQATLTIKE